MEWIYATFQLAFQVRDQLNPSYQLTLVTQEKISPVLNIVPFFPGEFGFGEREYSLAQAFIGPP